MRSKSIAIPTPKKDRAHEESKRLDYVALTRAKRKLHLLGHIAEPGAPIMLKPSGTRAAWMKLCAQNVSTRRVCKCLASPSFRTCYACGEALRWLRSLWRSPKNPTGLAPKTVRSIWNVMTLAFKFAVKWGYLRENPMGEKRVELPMNSTM